MSEAGGAQLSITFHPAAQDELAEGVAWYDRRQQALGDDLLNHVKRARARTRSSASARVAASVTAEPTLPAGAIPVRRVIYEVPPDEIRVLAVAHLRRRPMYWQGRESE